MSSILLVPIHLDALHLPYDRSVVEAMADFTRLPYFDGTRDVNPDVAYISEEIVSKPFQNQNLHLKAGIHLHWALPDALTRAAQRDDGTAYPTVPNRWLVTRYRNDVAEKQWVVESDYLFPADGKVYSSVCYPRDDDDTAQPFRFLGRNMDASFWPLDDDAAYLDPDKEPLTAVGYGEPTFAAFYPNCHSVFGLYDDQDPGADLVGLRYDVIGWYSDAAYDYLHTYLDGLRATSENANGPTWKEMLKAVEDQFKWLMTPNIILKDDFLNALGDPNGEAIWDELLSDTIGWLERIDDDRAVIVATEDRKAETLDDSAVAAGLDSDIEAVLEAERQVESLPEQILCYARVTLEDPTDESTDTNVSIAVGNTGTEALSSYLGDVLAREQGDPGQKAVIEDQLEALHLAFRLEHKQNDLGPKFQEARHEKGFTGSAAGIRWTIRPATETAAPADAATANAQSQVTLPDAMGHALNELNLRQQEYDQALLDIESMRKQIFADWYKYMLCAYPPEASQQTYPDIDEVRHFIEQKGLNPLAEKLDETGTLNVDTDTAGTIVGATAPGSDAWSLAGRVAAAVNDLVAQVGAFNEKEGVLYLPLDATNDDGDAVFDASGNGHDGVLVGSPDLVDDSTLGACLQFDGVDDYVDLGDDAALQITGNQTIEMWVNPASLDRRHTLFAKAFSGEGSLYLENDGTFSYYFGEGGDEDRPYQFFQTATAIPTEQWTHVAVVRDLDNQALTWYINGNEDAGDGKAVQLTAAASSTRATLGMGDNGNSFAGMMAHVRLYARALSADEVRMDMRNYRYTLKQTASARYWQPREPVVMMKGDIVEPTERHGMDGRLRDDDLLECHIWTGNENTAIQDLLTDTANREDTIEKIWEEVEANDNGIGFDETDGAPWHPFLLEWEAEVKPLKNKSNQTAESQDYEPDFITDNYTLDVNASDLTILSDRVVDSSASVFQGRSILTDYATPQLQAEIEAYLEKDLLEHLDDYLATAVLPDYLNAYFNDQGILPEDQPAQTDYDTYIADHYDDLKDWYLENYILPEYLDAYLDDRGILQEDRPAEADYAAYVSDHFDDGKVWYDETGYQLYFSDQYDDITAWYKATYCGTPGDATCNLIDAYEKITADDFHILSQALGGFNEALLMRRQVYQLPIRDPLGFDEYQGFAGDVDDAVVDQTGSAAQPLYDFNPIRAGAMEVLRLRLVDTFGQVQDLNVSTLVTTEQLADAGNAEGLTPLVWLPPRLTQPARINFRWLSADEGEQEMNDHPATSPICGWILPNNLDNSLMIYDAAGSPLGSINQRVEWEYTPGDDEIDVEDFADEHLQKVVNYLLQTDKDDQVEKEAFLEDFISTLDSALENIDPENYAQHQGLALLMGRPIAVVRASVNLELRGLPAIHQGWTAFGQDLNRQTRDDDAFTAVAFPIRLGEYEQLNDGLVGYWKENDDGTLDNTFYAPESDYVAGSSYVVSHSADPMNLYQTVAAEPLLLTLLVDPRGAVHATTGILPTKAIDIPPDQYSDALNAIEITFLSTPILTDYGALSMPLPTEPGYAWSWVQKKPTGWTEISTLGTIKKQAVTDAFANGNDIWAALLQNDIAWLVEVDAATATVTPKDKRTDESREALDAAYGGQVTEIEYMLDQTYIGKISTEAVFAGQQSLREGWLKLRSTSNA